MRPGASGPFDGQTPEVVGPTPVRRPRFPGRSPLVHVALFVVTLGTTTVAGAYNAGVPWDLMTSEWPVGLPFSLTLMGILLVHEMGHFLFARHHGIDATLPFFIPGPPVFIGTFGAFIRMKSPPQSRRALFDVGAAGPWAGLAVALPATAWGLAHSQFMAIPPGFMGLYFGDSLIFKILTWATIGPIPLGYDIVLHPVALAGWFGLFVTALNLLPVGQLDGGHVTYAMFGRRHRAIGIVVLLGIVALGFLGWVGWFVWAVLVSFIGVGHPPTLDREERLDPGRRILGWATIGVFVLTLVPIPVLWIEGGGGPAPEDLEVARSVEASRE